MTKIKVKITPEEKLIGHIACAFYDYLMDKNLLPPVPDGKKVVDSKKNNKKRSKKK